MPAVGDLLGQKYRVLDKLGAGGMGSVYRAENVLTGKQVALKWMHPEVACSADARERLLREARAGSRLHHPNVVDVYDVIEDQDTLFMVMELLHGETLRKFLERNPTPELGTFLELMLAAMQGVAAAHDVGVIHRDLKPDNIFLVGAPGSQSVQVKVVDFGIAKFSSAHGVTLTDTGKPLGTPMYMSLEQLRGDKDVDVRTDVYAFGVMLYEGITGRMPYEADTLPKLAIQVATTDATPVRAVRPDLPQTLARLIDASVSRDRMRRPADVRVMSSKLEAFARKDAASTRSSAERARAVLQLESQSREPAASMLQDTLSAHELLERQSARGRQRQVLLLALAAGLFAAAGTVYWSQVRPNEEDGSGVLQPSAAGPAPAVRVATGRAPAAAPEHTAASNAATDLRAATTPSDSKPNEMHAEPTAPADAAPSAPHSDPARAAATPQVSNASAPASEPRHKELPTRSQRAPGVAGRNVPRSREMRVAQSGATPAPAQRPEPAARRPTEIQSAPPSMPASAEAAKSAAEILAF